MTTQQILGAHLREARQMYDRAEELHRAERYHQAQERILDTLYFILETLEAVTDDRPD